MSYNCRPGTLCQEIEELVSKYGPPNSPNYDLAQEYISCFPEDLNTVQCSAITQCFVNNIVTNSMKIVTPNKVEYIGGSDAGWSDNNWTVPYTAYTSTYANCGFTIPRDIKMGEKLNVCGNIYNLSGGSVTISAWYYTCSEPNSLTLFGSNSSLGMEPSSLRCFNYYFPTPIEFTKCDTFIVIGFLNTTPSELKITYNVNI
jgi:hypothetical protein